MQLPWGVSQDSIITFIFISMGGTTDRATTTMVHNPQAVSHSRQRASHVCAGHASAKAIQNSFTMEESHTASLMAPKGCTIISPSDLMSVAVELTPIETKVVPRRDLCCCPKEIRFVALGLRKLVE